MQKLPGKSPEGPQNARELALELVAYMMTGDPSVPIVREKQEALLDAACSEARKALAQANDLSLHRFASEIGVKVVFGGMDEQGRALGEPLPGVGMSIGKSFLVAGARVTNEPCPSCKGSGKLSRHEVTFRRSDTPPPQPQRVAEALRQRDEARAERDAMTPRMDELEAQRDAAHDLVRELQRERDRAISEAKTMGETLTSVQTRCTELRQETEEARGVCALVTKLAKGAS